MKQISLEKLGKIVEQKRRQLELTQEELAKLTNMNRNIISRIECKNHLPSLSQLNALLKELNINFEEILEEESNSDIFIAMLGETQSEKEKKGFNQMISMVLRLRKHHRLRRT
ncbi:MAG: helix-turn-helix transcriptional regulator [Halanaerobiales bacterium]|nr:helix-turn-helix transcriptional regulator [Halanaerobiales bacterium]